MIQWNSFYAARAQGDYQNLVSTLADSIVQMAGGFPDERVFPGAEALEAMQSLYEQAGPALMQYAGPIGYEPLRQWVAERAGGSTPLSANHVLLTHGAQQGIDLIARMLLDPGDTVIVEAPTFHGALWVFQSHGARILSVPLEQDGMDVSCLKQMLADLARTNQLPKFIYTIPTFHNPTGYTTSLERRVAMLEICSTFGVSIVEDLPYSDIWYDAPPLPSYLELSDHSVSVIQLGTFSKTLCPAFRVGWMIGDESFIAKTIHFKHISDTCSSLLMQRTAHELCSNGFLERNVSKARNLYRQKRDALMEALARHPIEGASCSRPGGGFFAWLTLPAGMSATVLKKHALEAGVAVAASPMFYEEEGRDHACRITFSCPQAAEIETGVGRLATAMNRLIQQI